MFKYFLVYQLIFSSNFIGRNFDSIIWKSRDVYKIIYVHILILFFIAFLSNKNVILFLAIDISFNGVPIWRIGSRVEFFQYGLGGKCRFTLLYNKSLIIGVPDRISQTMNHIVNSLGRDNERAL